MRPARNTGTAIRTLLTSDGVRVSVVHRPARTGSRDLAFVLAHGFTGSWRTPAMGAVSRRLAEHGGVLAVDFRGHGGSTGATTVGGDEVFDLDAVVNWARLLGYRRIATIGFSMGGSIVVRHAALVGGVDAVVSVSGPGWWFYRGTRMMRLVHWLIERRLGRVVARFAMGTRIDPDGWRQIPDSPSELAGRVSPVPLLVVHGDADPYFPLEHARALYEAAREPRELWVEPGFGHAEVRIAPELVDRIGDWAARTATGPSTAVRHPAPPADDESEGSPA
jgi:pimeloyl-ACP methyl ester carboxylesterase